MKKLPKILRYEITQDDIDNATPCPENCPHARALKRLVGEKLRIRMGINDTRVYGGRVSIKAGDIRYYYSAPSYTQKFEGAFDTGGSVVPGIAVIRLVDTRGVHTVEERRKNQINAARRMREVAQKATGVSPKSYDGRLFTAA